MSNPPTLHSRVAHARVRNRGAPLRIDVSETAAVRLRLTDPLLCDDLLDFLRRVGCLAVRVNRHMVDAQLLNSVSERYDQQELAAYMKVWMVMHPEATVEIDDRK